MESSVRGRPQPQDAEGKGLVLTMALPFAISLKDVKYRIYLLVFLTPNIDVFYYTLNVPYSSMLSAVFGVAGPLADLAGSPSGGDLG